MIEFSMTFWYKVNHQQHHLHRIIMNEVTVEPKFQVSIPAKLRKRINLKEGDIMEAIQVDDGISFKVKQVSSPKKFSTEKCESADTGEVDSYDDQPSNCFRPFPIRGGVVANEMIDKLRNEVGD